MSSEIPDQKSPAEPGDLASDKDQYREFFERSADAILIIEGGTFVDCNRAAVAMLRYQSREEFLQTHPSELSPEMQPDGRPSFVKANEMIAEAKEKGSHRFEWIHLRADGEAFPVEVLLTPMPDDGRDRLHVVWRDITGRKQLENELRQAQKMEALGRLTGGIAHDFNNLLVAILGYAELLQIELPAESSAWDHVEQIRKAGDRAAALVAQLLAFSRKQIVQPRTVEIGALLSDMTRLLEPMLGEHIRLSITCHDQPLYVVADPGQFEQVIVNLATNARDAILDQGTLNITVRRGIAPAGSAADAPGLPHALLEVADSGAGIPRHLLARIFEPFFTTKDPGKGTGLGLSTVHGIVQQSGGGITVTSSEGAGATFRICLPLTDVPPEEDTTPWSPQAARPRPSETVLLVEDDTAVARLMAATLTRAGYRLHIAANGEQALALVASQQLRPDLLLTDVIMPEMGGPELARELQRQQPDLKVLFASGYTGDELVARGTLEEGVELIQKPFPPSRLLKRIRELFDRA